MGASIEAMAGGSVKPGVLFLSNDHSVPFAKTTEFLAGACERLGYPAIVRDTFDHRIHRMMLEGKPEAQRRAMERLRRDVNELIEAFNIQFIVGLDLFWLYYPEPLLDSKRIRRIISIWFDDFRTWVTYPTNVWFSDREIPFQEINRHSKLLHVFYGSSMAQEAQLYGISNQIGLRLAAPAEFLRHKHPCEIRDKAVFIGNPGFRGEPHPDALEAMRNGADVRELRSLSRDHLLRSGDASVQRWFQMEPQTRQLLALAMETKVQAPFAPSLEMLRLAGQHYPRAFEFANQQGVLLDFSLLVKLVTRYDRPALVSQLYRKGLVDVYSNEKEWEPYGVKAGKNINLGELPAYYQKYSVHLNGANALRDATANEKLFEIAACGRVSVNLKSSDVTSCYNPGEIVTADTLEEIEGLTRELLGDPDRALAMGQQARQHTAREHLWDHRMREILKTVDVG